MGKSELSIRNVAISALFIALITIGTFIRIPIPLLPFTLQFLFTMLAGLLLGGRWGALTVFIYIVLGLMGVPVFTEGGGPADTTAKPLEHWPSAVWIYMQRSINRC